MSLLVTVISQKHTVAEQIKVI